MIPKTFDLSVIIPTYNRYESLVNLCKSLSHQEDILFEVIIMDQSYQNSRGIKDEFKEFIKDARFNRHVCDFVSTTKAKNLAIYKAKSEIVLMLDDDVIPLTRHLLFNHRRHYANKDIVGVTGKVVDEFNQANRADKKPVGWVTSSGRVIVNSNSNIKTGVRTVFGGNASFRKDALIKIGGYDENFVGNAMREETDLSLRLQKLNVELLYDPEAGVFHHRRKTGGTRSVDRKQWYQDYFANLTLFFLKHVSRIHIVSFILNQMRPIFACWVYYGKFNLFWLIAAMRGFYQGYRRYRDEKKQSLRWL